MSPEELEQERSFTDGATAALLRAAKRAREIAQQTGTAIVIRRDGELVRERPAADNEGESKAKSA